MRQPKWLGAFGVLALMVAAGCEDPPTTVVTTLGTSPSPGSSPSSSAGASASPHASPLAPVTPYPSGIAPSPQQGGFVTPTPFNATPSPASGGSSPTPTPVPTASPTPSPMPVPTASPGLVKLSFTTPIATTDFGATAVPITAVASPSSGSTLQELDLYYDGQRILQQKSSASTIAALTWNPNVANNLSNPGSASPVPYGNHLLRVEAVTTSGNVSGLDFPFYKPFEFKGWLNTSTAQGNALTLPPLPQARTSVRLYASNTYLFAFFGEQPGPTPANSVLALSLNLPGQPVWNTWSASNLQWRQHVALAGSDALTYLVGGRPSGTGSNLAAPSKRVDVFDLFNHAGQPVHDLPDPLTDTSAVVLGGYLYVVGGSSTGVAADVTPKVYRLALGSTGKPDAAVDWEPRAALPSALRGVATVVADGHLYALGGQAADGSRRESVLTYDEVADAWVHTAYLPTAASGGTAVDLGGSIYYLGGYGADGLPNAKTMRFDYGDTASTRAFAEGAPNLPTGRAFEGATVYTDTEHGQRVFVAGGETAATAGTTTAIAPIADVIVGDTL